MNAFGKLWCFCGVAIFAAAGGTPAWGQIARTWVASTGNDANACSRAAPCATFQEAHDNALANGEINCVDAGSFGTVTIAKSITIDCTGVIGATLVPAGINGVFIDTAGVNVVLRGLTITGGPNNVTAAISFFRGESLVIDNVTVQRINGNGIRFLPSTAARLHVVNSLVTNSGNVGAGSGAGIVVDPGGVGYANVTIEDTRLIGNVGTGLLVDVTGNTGSSTNVIVNRTAFTSSNNGVSVIAPPGTAGGSVTISDSIVTNNVVNGLLASGTSAQITVSNTAIAGNTNGLATNGGAAILSYGNNRLTRNGTNGAFSGVVTQN